MLLLLLASTVTFSQFRNKAGILNDSTEYIIKGGTKSSQGFINATYLDTTAANLSRIDDYPGAQIFCTGDNSFWIRDKFAKKWILKDPSGGITTNIYNDSILVICNSYGSCDTLVFAGDIFNYYFLNDSTLVACGDTSVVCQSDTCILQQVCDTLFIPTIKQNVYQSGVEKTGEIVRLGVGSGSFNNPNSGLPINWLQRPTTINTFAYTLTKTGFPVWQPITHTYQQQGFGITTDISTWRGAGGMSDTAIDFNNSVLFHLGQTGRTYGGIIDSGYYGKRIGYTIGTNLSGRSSYGVGVDNPSSKWGTILFNTLDTSHTRSVIEFYGSRPPLQNLINDPMQAPQDVLSSKRIMRLNWDKTINIDGYGLGNITGTPTYTLQVDANGKIIEGSPSGGGGVDNKPIGTAHPVLKLNQDIRSLRAKDRIGLDTLNLDEVGITSYDSIASTSIKNISDLRATGYHVLTARKKNSNDITTIDVQGYSLAGDGGNSKRWWCDTCTIVDDGGYSIKPTSVSGAGRWILEIDNSTINTKQYGVSESNTGADNRDRMVKLLAFAKTYPSLCRRIFVDKGNYPLSDSLLVDFTVEIVGTGSGYDGSGFSFPADKKGLRVTGAKPSFFNLFFSGSKPPTGYDSSKHGITVNCETYMRNVKAINFGGIGFYIYGEGLDSPPSNTDHARFEYCYSESNGVHGFYTRGGDANIITFDQCEARDNNAGGFIESGFLGNHYENCHSVGNSQWNTGYPRSLAKYGGTVYQALQTGFLGRPDLAPGKWHTNNELAGWIGSVQIPDFDSARYFFVGGAYNMDGENSTVSGGGGENQFTHIDNCYSEGGMPYSYAGDKVIVTAGDHATPFREGTVMTSFSKNLNVRTGIISGFAMGDSLFTKMSKEGLILGGNANNSNKGVGIDYDTLKHIVRFRDVVAYGTSPISAPMAIGGYTSLAADWGRTDNDQRGSFLIKDFILFRDVSTASDYKLFSFHTEIPTTGNFKRGDFRFNAQPTSRLSPAGFRNITGGSPGTWDTVGWTPSGGTNGQVLTKSSNTAFDYYWATPSAGGGGVTGSAAAGQGTYWTAPTTIAGSTSYLVNPTLPNPYEFKTASTSPLGGTYYPLVKFYATGATNGHIMQMLFGKDDAANDAISFDFTYASSGSTSNKLSVAPYGGSPIATFHATGNSGFGSSSDIGEKLYVNGNSHIGSRHSAGTGYYGGLANPHASAVLQAQSTTKGFLPPVGTAAQMNAITTPATGLIFINSDSIGVTNSGVFVYDGSGWRQLVETRRVGSGATPTLQQVTNAGNITTRYIHGNIIDVAVTTGRYSFNTDSAGLFYANGWAGQIRQDNSNGNFIFSPSSASGTAGGTPSYGTPPLVLKFDGGVTIGGLPTTAQAYVVMADASGNLHRVDTTTALGGGSGGSQTLQQVLDVGSDITSNETITTNTNTLTITGNPSTTGALAVTSTGSQAALRVTNSGSGYALSADVGQSSLAGVFINKTGTGTNSIIANPLFRLWAQGGTIANGFGAKVMSLDMETSTGGNVNAMDMEVFWENATTANATSQINILGNDNATMENFMNIQKDIIRFNNNADTVSSRAYARSVAGGGSGDMILASVQSVTGLKTFDKDKLAMKGTSTGVTTISTANTSATDYTATLQAATGTIAYTSDITGTNSGTNTGDQNLFSSIPVSGQTTVTANSTTTALTFVAGSNMTITTNNTTKEITFAATGSGGANALGTYLVQTATNAPANAQIMGSLATGLVKNTTTTGVQSIATAGTDYIAPTDRRVSFQLVTGTDASITVAAGTAYHLPAATLSTGRNLDMTNVNTNGDYVEFYNNEEGFVWTFTGQTVYDSDGATAVTELLINTNSVVRRINGKLMISKL